MTVKECRAKTGKRTVFYRQGCGLDGGDVAFTINGNGMSPLYNDKDEVIVEYTDTLEPGSIGVFLVDGKQPAIRQYYPDGLRSFRPDLETMHLTLPVSEYPIIGKVLGVVTEDMKPTPAEEAILREMKENNEF